MTERRKRRFWLWYFGIFLALIALSFGYAWWRGSTLEPLNVALDMPPSGTYRARVGVLRFYASRYRPAFSIVLSTPTDDDWWWSTEDAPRKIWGDAPPILHLIIRDSTGAVVLQEMGPLSNANGWTVSQVRSAGAIHYEMSKRNEFQASPFRSYTVDMRVIQDRPTSNVASAHFCITTNKGYVLLPIALLTMFLAGLMIVSTPVVLFFRWLLARQRPQLARP